MSGAAVPGREAVILSREEYEALVNALREAIALAKEAVRQRDELLRLLKEKRGEKRGS